MVKALKLYLSSLQNNKILAFKMLKWKLMPIIKIKLTRKLNRSSKKLCKKQRICPNQCRSKSKVNQAKLTKISNQKLSKRQNWITYRKKIWNLIFTAKFRLESRISLLHSSQTKTFSLKTKNSIRFYAFPRRSIFTWTSVTQVFALFS
jgi:hypothetical protein